MEEVASQADLVIEAVPEKAEIKRAVFESLEQFVPEHCLFATNTSTMSPTEIGSYGKRPEKTIAMHFFNPVHKMPLVEIVRGLKQVMRQQRSFVKWQSKWGKKQSLSMNSQDL